MKKGNRVFAVFCVSLFLLAALLLIFSFPVLSASYGDVNADGVVDVRDVVLVMRHALGIPPGLDADQRLLADVNGDGAINVLDVSLIARYSLGLIADFPVNRLEVTTVSAVDARQVEVVFNRILNDREKAAMVLGNFHVGLESSPGVNRLTGVGAAVTVAEDEQSVLLEMGEGSLFEGGSTANRVVVKKEVGLEEDYVVTDLAYAGVEDYASWAVGKVDDQDKALLLYSGDSGQTWTRQGLDDLPEGQGLSSIIAPDRQTAWAVGEAGLIIRTEDGGGNWSIVEPGLLGPDNELLDISLYGENVWIGGSQGLILHSPDGGTTWAVIDSFDNPDKVMEFIIQGIFAIDDSIVYAVGNRSEGEISGIVLRTEDGGETWEDIELPNQHNRHGWIGVKATDPDHVVIHGGTGYFAVTANGGEQWVAGGPIFPWDINDLVMVSESDYWVACDYDYISRTENSGISWEQQPLEQNTGSFLLGIDAVDGTRAVIAGGKGSPSSGLILVTVDGGQNWITAYEADGDLLGVTIASP